MDPSSFTICPGSKEIAEYCTQSSIELEHPNSKHELQHNPESHVHIPFPPKKVWRVLIDFCFSKIKPISYSLRNAY